MLEVFPTDTIYGIGAPALNKVAVEELYKAKGRTPTKPTAVLISNQKELALFGVTPTKYQQRMMRRYWPGAVTLIFETHEPKKFFYLHRGTKTLAFRVPKDRKFRAFLAEKGPMAVSSANPEGKEPAETIKQAQSYFGKKVATYTDGGVLKRAPSTFISLVGDTLKIVRQGAGISTFHTKVIDVLRSISNGTTLTYKEVARRAGSPNASRAVGTVISTNFDPAVPCHRVIRSDGTVGAYNRGGPKAKESLLKEEGWQTQK